MHLKLNQMSFNFTLYSHLIRQEFFFDEHIRIFDVFGEECVYLAKEFLK